MPTLELSSAEVSLLQGCVALVLGGVFQDKIKAEKISKVFKNNPRKLEVLYSKLEHPREKKDQINKSKQQETRVRVNRNRGVWNRS